MTIKKLSFPYLGSNSAILKFVLLEEAPFLVIEPILF